MAYNQGGDEQQWRRREMKIIAMMVAIMMAPWASANSADTTRIDGAAHAYFPGGVFDTALETDEIRHYSHIDEDSLVAYNLYVFKGHGETPSLQWLEGFVEGQALSVPSGEAHILSFVLAGSEVRGEFYVEGLMEGRGYEKACSFIMNRSDYGTWCVAAIDGISDTQVGAEAFVEHAGTFRLLE